MSWEDIIKQKRFEVRLYDPLYASRKNKIPYTVLRIFSSRAEADQYVASVDSTDEESMQYYAVIEVGEWLNELERHIKRSFWFRKRNR